MTGFRITTSSGRMSPWVMWLRWSLCLGNLLWKSLVLNCPLDRGVYELTEALDLPLSLIKAIINGTLPITMDVALRLGKFYSMDPKFWLHLQTEYDSRKAKRGLI